MILGTVGTHHQPHTRLVSALDEFARSHPDERVVIQAGPAAGLISFAEGHAFLDPAEISALVDEARIVVTHAGPSLLLSLCDAGRQAVVVPRLRHFGEHVDDHQRDFAAFLADRDLVIVARDSPHLVYVLEHYEELVAGLNPIPLEPADPIRTSTLILEHVQAHIGSASRRTSQILGEAIPLALQRGLWALALILSAVPIARQLGVEEVADWAVLTAMLTVSRIGADFGLDRSLPRWLTQRDQVPTRIIGAGLKLRFQLGVVAGIAVAAVGSVLVRDFGALWMIALVPVAMAPTVVATAWAIEKRRTRALLFSSVGSFILIQGAALTVIPRIGLVGLAGAVLVAALFEACAAWWAADPESTLAGNRQEWVTMLRNSSGFGVQGILGALYARLPVLVLTSVGPAVVAAFWLGYSFYAVAGLGLSAISLAVLPKLTAAANARSRFLAVSRSLVPFAAFVALGSVVFILVAPELVSVVFGDNFLSAIGPARILASGAVFVAGNAYLSTSLFALNADTQAVGVSVGATVLLGVLIFVLRSHGASGAAAAVVLTEGCALFVSAGLVRQRLNRLP